MQGPLRTKSPPLTEPPLLMQGPLSLPRTRTPPLRKTASPGELQVTKVTFQAIPKPEGAFEQMRTSHSFLQVKTASGRGHSRRQ